MLRCVPMTVTVQMMRSAAVMDVDISVRLRIEVLIWQCVGLFFKCSDLFSDEVCLTEKPGVCPSKTLIIGVCAEICSHDSDCPNDEKCCSNGCGHQCMDLYIGMLLHTNALVIFFSITVIHSVIWFLCVCIQKSLECVRGDSME